jgi:TusA-related sulfurtransferase
MAMDEMKRVNTGEIEIIVDTDTSKENVSRAAESQGWQIKNVHGEGEGYRVIITKV